MARSVPRLQAWSTAALLASAAALLVAGCGGSGSSSGPTTPAKGGAPSRGASKPATAPNAPAGSKVISCEAGSARVKELRATEVDCATAVQVIRRWGQTHACALGASDSRGSCSLGRFRCQTVRDGRGASVSCARPGEDISFVADAASLKRGAG